MASTPTHLGILQLPWRQPRVHGFIIQYSHHIRLQLLQPVQTHTASSVACPDVFRRRSQYGNQSCACILILNDPLRLRYCVAAAQRHWSLLSHKPSREATGKLDSSAILQPCRACQHAEQRLAPGPA